MSSFNVRKFANNTNFTCQNCGKVTSYYKISAGCHNCGYHFFKVSTRSGTPSGWDWDRMLSDPYRRQRQKSIDPTTEEGYSLVAPDDEDDFGGTGFGQRFRGKDTPRNFSQTSEEYEDQMEKDIPTDPDDLLRNPPTKTDLGDWFADPEDILSVRGTMDKAPQDKALSIEGKLKERQQFGNTFSKELDDSIFGRLTKSLKGVTR